MNWLTRLWTSKALPREVTSLQPRTAITQPRARLSWEQGFAGFVNPFFTVPQNQNLYLLEQIPQLIPSVGSALRILTQLVGCPKIESENMAAAQEANEWWEMLPVNQTGHGGGVWFSGHCYDHLLYGRAHTEIILTARQQEVFALQELHPRTIELRPRQGYGVDLVQSNTFLGLRQALEPRELFLTTVHGFAQDSPQGASILMNLPRVAEILNKMLVSLSNTWERFGTPTFFVRYRPAKEISDPSGAKASEVIGTVVSGLEASMLAKASGNTRDIAAAGDFDIEILGANGEALDIEVPGRLLLEEISSAFGLPAWMLNKHWSTTERLSTEQAKLIGEGVDEIREHLEPSVRYLFELRQAIVGRPFEWDICWEAPSLVDQKGEADAEKAEADALAAKTKANKDLWSLGVLKPFEFVQRVRPDMAEKTEAEILAALPELLAQPPAPVSPFGGGPPGQEEQGGPPNRPVPGTRSITYVEDELLVKSTNGRH